MLIFWDFEKKRPNNSSNGNNQLNDSIEKKLNKLGLRFLSKFPLSTTVQTMPTWIRIHRNIAYISGHGPQNSDASVAGPCGKVCEELDTAGITIGQVCVSTKLTGHSLLVTLQRFLIFLFQFKELYKEL